MHLKNYLYKRNYVNQNCNFQIFEPKPDIFSLKLCREVTAGETLNASTSTQRLQSVKASSSEAAAATATTTRQSKTAVLPVFEYFKDLQYKYQLLDVLTIFIIAPKE